MGLREQLIFPEIDYDKIDKVRGMVGLSRASPQPTLMTTLSSLGICMTEVYPNFFISAGAGIVKAEGAMYACKVMLVCPKCGKPTRIAHKILNDGTKQRLCKNTGCGETF